VKFKCENCAVIVKITRRVEKEKCESGWRKKRWEKKDVVCNEKKKKKNAEKKENEKENVREIDVNCDDF